jgi:hypothetical protein
MFRKHLVISLLVSFILIAGCTGGPTLIATQNSVEIPSPVPPTEAPTATIVPIATRVLIATGPQLPEADVQSIVGVTQTLAGQSGLSVETIPSLTPELLTPDVKVAVVLPPDPGINDLAGRYPDIRFISVAIPSIQPATNLFVVGADGTHPEWSGFMAGYISAILTNEWRVGALTQAGSNEGLLAGDGFRNGVSFFCGLCQKKFAPFNYDSPILELNPNASQPEWQPVADAFIASSVKTAYIYPGVANPEMMAYLAQGGMKLIGSQTPPDALRPAWIATINLDYSAGLQAAWADILSGAPGKVVPASLSVTDIDTNMLTDGKMRLVNELIGELTAGAIAPNTVQ